MTHKVEFALASSEDVEAALGRRIDAIRLSRNLTQAQLAEKAGVSRSTLTRLAQDGKGISLDSFIRILQALQLHDHLQALLPDPAMSPLMQLETKGQVRRRARAKKKNTDAWTWNDNGQQE